MGVGSTATYASLLRFSSVDLGRGGGLQCHDSSQSRGGEDRLRVGLTGTVCFDVAEFPEEESDGCCNDRTDERRPVFRP